MGFLFLFRIFHCWAGCLSVEVGYFASCLAKVVPLNNLGNLSRVRSPSEDPELAPTGITSLAPGNGTFWGNWNMLLQHWNHDLPGPPRTAIYYKFEVSEDSTSSPPVGIDPLTCGEEQWSIHASMVAHKKDKHSIGFGLRIGWQRSFSWEHVLASVHREHEWNV